MGNQQTTPPSSPTTQPQSQQPIQFNLANHILNNHGGGGGGGDSNPLVPRRGSANSSSNASRNIQNIHLNWKATDLVIYYTKTFTNAEMSIGNCDRIILSYKERLGKYIRERGQVAVYCDYVIPDEAIKLLYNLFRNKEFDKITSVQSKISKTSGSDAGTTIVLDLKSANYRYEVKSTERNTIVAKYKENFAAIDEGVREFNKKNLNEHNVVVTVRVDKTIADYYFKEDIPVTAYALPKEGKPKRKLFTIQPIKAAPLQQNEDLKDPRRGSFHGLTFERRQSRNLELDYVIKRVYVPLGTCHLVLAPGFDDEEDENDEDDAAANNDEERQKKAELERKFTFRTPTEHLFDSKQEHAAFRFKLDTEKHEMHVIKE